MATNERLLTSKTLKESTDGESTFDRLVMMVMYPFMVMNWRFPTSKTLNESSAGESTWCGRL